MSRRSAGFMKGARRAAAAGTVLALSLLASTDSSGASECTSPIVYSGGLDPGDTFQETPGGSSSCDPLGGAPTAWYQYTASCDGILHADTCGSGFDTILSVHTPACPASSGTQLASGCNNDCPSGGAPFPGCGAPDSCVNTPVTQGQTVLIRLTGAGGASGPYNLYVECDVPNDTCEEAENLIAGTTTPGSTRGADWDEAATCDGYDNTGPGVWYTVVGNGNVLEASTCNAGTTYDSKISVYCAGCGGQQCVTANDDACGLQSRVSWCSTPGEIYHVLVHGYGQSEGPFDLDITDTGTYCGPYYANCSPANDTCASALPLYGQVLGDNTSAGTDGSATCQATGGDVWFEKDLLCHGVITYDTCQAFGTLDDTVLSVQDACGGTELACNDDAAGCGLRSEVTLASAPGRTHTIRVADYAGDGPDEGSFVLQASAQIPLPIVPQPGLYVAGGQGLYILQHVYDGFRTDLGSLGAGDIRGLAWGRGMGLLFGLDHATNQILAIDPNNAQVTPIVFTGFGDFRSLAWDPDRLVLYTVDTSTGTLFTLDPFTGKQTPLFGVGTLGIEALAYREDTETLYAWDASARDLMLIQPWGPSVAWAGVTTNLQFKGLGYDPVTGILHGIGRGSGYSYDVTASIDPATGEVAADPITWNIQAVVEAMTRTEGMPEGAVGQPYATPLPVSGGCPPYTVTGATGVPPGLSLSWDGLLSGTPTETGIFHMEFGLSDSTFGNPPVPRSAVVHIPPANDACEGALAVTDGSTPFTTTGGLTGQPYEPLCDLNFDPDLFQDIWYTYQATCTGIATLDTCGSGFNTKLAVYDGGVCPQSASAVACDDNSCNNLNARVVRPVVQGDVLTLRVGGVNHEYGQGTLNIACEPTGGCCGAAGGCSQETAPDCQDTGGVYLGNNASCSPDSDGDGWNDTCESCPSDPGKIEPLVCGCGVPDSDLDGDTLPDCIDTDKDGDGILDVNDWEPLNRLACRDDDGDSCDDCSSGTYNVAADGIDTDADGICDLTDCADSDPGTWRLPGEAESLALAADTQSISWNPPADQGGQPGGLLYDLVRGGVPDDFSTAGCMETDTSSTQSSDVDDPLPGSAYFYLVRAQNACGEGSLGVGYPLNPRIGPLCP